MIGSVSLTFDPRFHDTAELTEALFGAVAKQCRQIANNGLSAAQLKVRITCSQPLVGAGAISLYTSSELGADSCISATETVRKELPTVLLVANTSQQILSQFIESGCDSFTRGPSMTTVDSTELSGMISTALPKPSPVGSTSTLSPIFSKEFDGGSGIVEATSSSTTQHPKLQDVKASRRESEANMIVIMAIVLLAICAILAYIEIASPFVKREPQHIAEMHEGVVMGLIDFDGKSGDTGATDMYTRHHSVLHSVLHAKAGCTTAANRSRKTSQMWLPDAPLRPAPLDEAVLIGEPALSGVPKMAQGQVLPFHKNLEVTPTWFNSEIGSEAHTEELNLVQFEMLGPSVHGDITATANGRGHVEAHEFQDINNSDGVCDTTTLTTEVFDSNLRPTASSTFLEGFVDKKLDIFSESDGVVIEDDQTNNNVPLPPLAAELAVTGGNDEGIGSNKSKLLTLGPLESNSTETEVE
jgi:hypothetical protein